MVPEGWTEAKVKELPGQNGRPVTKLGPFGSSLKKSDYTPSGYKVYGQQQVLANDEDFGDYWISEDKFKSLQACEVQPGDILLSTMGSFGSALRLTEHCAPGIINPRLLRLSISAEIADPRFLEFFFKSSLAERQFLSFAQGGTMPAVNGASIGGLKVPLPPLAEQRKIADILSTWDRAIETTEALLATARTQKRALMQTLLTGKRRFPEFKGKEWKEVRLGDVLEISYGKSPKDIIAEVGEYPVLGTGGVTGRTNTAMAEGPAIVIGRKGTIDSPQWVEGSFWCIDTTYFCEAKKGVDLAWVFAWLRSINLRIYNEASGVPSLSRETLRAIRLSLPGLEEQSSIAEVFTACDAEIVSVTAQVEKLRTEKKALMQQLLTGKRRVVV